MKTKKLSSRFASRPIILYGAGSQVHSLRDILARQRFDPVVVFNDLPPPNGFDAPAPVIVGQQDIAQWLESNGGRLHYAVTIGNHHGRERFDRHVMLRNAGARPATLVHETAYVAGGASLGAACQILAFAFVGPDSIIGDAVIINSKASVDHECKLGAGVHIGPGAILAGRVTVGDFTFIGSGAVVCPDVHIASKCRIGAGAVVNRDIEEPGIYVGVPAKLIRSEI